MLTKNALEKFNDSGSAESLIELLAVSTGEMGEALTEIARTVPTRMEWYAGETAREEGGVRGLVLCSDGYTHIPGRGFDIDGEELILSVEDHGLGTTPRVRVKLLASKVVGFGGVVANAGEMIASERREFRTVGAREAVERWGCRPILDGLRNALHYARTPNRAEARRKLEDVAAALVAQ